MPTIVIRPALQAERSSLEALQWRASLANSGDRDSLLANPDAIALPVGQIADGHVFVAQRDGVIVGFAAVLARPDGNAELDALFVEPSLWKRGVGRLLVETLRRCRARSRLAHPARRRQPARGRLLCRVRLSYDRSRRDSIRRRSRDAAWALTRSAEQRSVLSVEATMHDHLLTATVRIDRFHASVSDALSS